MRLLVAAIKHKKPQLAVSELALLNYSAALPLQKVLKQAIANATNNHKLNPDTLTIKEILVNQGWTLKRFRAGARGRGKPYTKRRSHVTVRLESRLPNAQAPKPVKQLKPGKSIKPASNPKKAVTPAKSSTKTKKLTPTTK
jgi:large subunit ribosomal protein L22